MEYYLKSGPVIKKKYRLGFLDDNIDNDFHNQLLAGIAEAAAELDAEVLRFCYYYSRPGNKFFNQMATILDHIRQYELDGLMFLGWTKAGAMYNRQDFMSRFGSIPVLSLGTIYEDIPNVYFIGDEFVRQAVIHLVEAHRLERIAFIEHHRPDSRINAYEYAMKEYGVYDPRLCITWRDLTGLDAAGRSKRAVEMLLDERKLDVEAIISLNIIETGYVIGELKKRGIDIPGDIAVISYEDGRIGQFSSPGYTTVYYPWKELGYVGCKNMVRLLKEGRIPMATSLNRFGKLIFRESCGCLPYYVNPVPGIPPVYDYISERINMPDKAGIPENGASREKSGTGGGKAEGAEEMVIGAARALVRKRGGNGIDYAVLVKLFLEACAGKNGAHFLREFDRQLGKLPAGCRNVEELPAELKELVQPCLYGDLETMLRAGDIFLRAHVLANEKAAALHGNEILEAREIDQNLQFISHALLTDFNLQNLTDTLEKGMESLNIRNCFLFAAASVMSESDDKGKCPDDYVLVFKYRNGRREPVRSLPADIRRQFSELLAENEETVLLSYLLHVTDEVLGFVIFGYGPSDVSVYQTLSTHIGAAVSRIVLLKRLDSMYKKLVDQAHREGMADIAVDILHNIGNILNSINVSVHLMEECSESPVTEDMALAGRLLKENMHRLEEFICNDEKGRKLMRFYLKLGQAAEKMQNQLQYNLDRLKSKINEINETIAAQQNYAVTDKKPEELHVEPILEDALKLNQEMLDNLKIKVERKYLPGFKAHVNRAKLFFVLFNVVVNAIDSMNNVPDTNRKLTISMDEDETGRYVRISDTGVGIPGNMLNRIFEYGFTTKYGKYGYGLYSCASFMSDMGGSISAESEGEGKGATFILKFY